MGRQSTISTRDTPGPQIRAASWWIWARSIPLTGFVSFSTISTESALWILVEGTPKDYVLKVNPTTGALITNFSTDGWAQAPSADTEGIEYFDGYVYIIANEGSGCCDKQRQLYKINATTGNTESGYPKNMGNNGVNDDLGDITNDGTNLVAWTKSNWNDVYVFDTAASDSLLNI